MTQKLRHKRKFRKVQVAVVFSCLLVFYAEDGGNRLVDSRELEGVGELFVDALSEMKHNGAVEKCVGGLVALTER